MFCSWFPPPFLLFSHSRTKFVVISSVSFCNDTIFFCNFADFFYLDFFFFANFKTTVVRSLRKHFKPRFSGEIYADEWGCRWIDFFFENFVIFWRQLWKFCNFKIGPNETNIAPIWKILSLPKSWDSQQHYGTSLASQRFVKVLVLTPFWNRLFRSKNA